VKTQNKIICLVINSLQAGGMERVMSELAIEFASNPSYKVHLVLYGISREVFYTIPNSIIIHRPPFTFDGGKRFISTIRTLYFLRKKLKSVQADAILSFGEYWNSFVLLACIGLKLPIYVSDRCQPDKDFGKMQTLLRKWLYPTASGIVAQTQIAQSIYLRTIKQSNVTVIGNPIRMVDDNQTIQKENIVLTVGRLISTKHHDKLIEMFVRINNPEWKLVIIGDDALKQKNMARLQTLVNDLGANEKVVLLGKQSDVKTYYLKSEIFAFTSSSEGFPNVIGEAQAAGLPVVAFDCIAGPAEMLVDGENGYLVPLFDYCLFEKRLTQLMEQSALRKKMRDNARRSVQQFSSSKISLQFEKFILNYS